MPDSSLLSDEKRREEARRALLGLPPEEPRTSEPSQPLETFSAHAPLAKPIIPPTGPVASESIAPEHNHPEPQQAVQNQAEPQNDENGLHDIFQELEEERLKRGLANQEEPLQAPGDTSLDSLSSLANNTELHANTLTIAEKPAPQVPPAPYDDRYREKPSLSDYEAKKAAPIEQARSAQKPREDMAPIKQTIQTVVQAGSSNQTPTTQATLAHMAAVALDKRGREQAAVAQKASSSKRRTITISLLALSIVLILAALFGIYREQVFSRIESLSGKDEPSAQQREGIVLSGQSPSDLGEQVTQSGKELQRVPLLLAREDVLQEVDSLTALQAFGLYPPRLIEQALDGSYGAGTHEQAVFTVLGISSYEYAFAGMLEWESRLPGELAALYPSDAQAGSFARFSDTTMQNIDMRVAEDAAGNQLFAYAILNQDFIVIAKDTDAIVELAKSASNLAQAPLP